jgi:hypothetical protein
MLPSVPARIAAMVLMAAALPASAERIVLCDAPVAGATVLEKYVDPGGKAIELAVGGEAPSACKQVEIPVEAAQVRWARLLTPAEAARLDLGISLQGTDKEGRFTVSEVSGLESSASAPAALPLSAELLDVLQPAPFGVEERAVVRRDGAAIVLECRAGTRPAGATLSAGRPLPRGARLEIELAYEAEQAFRIGLADSARTGRGDPAWLGTAVAGERNARWTMPTEGADPGGWQSWTVLCPESSGRLVLRSLSASPRPPAAAPPGRALWAWRPAQWLETPARLLDTLEKSRADMVYLTVPVRAGTVEHAEELRGFVAGAARRGVKVWAVTGDPRAVLPQERAVQAGLARAYAEYNRSADPESRLAGLQLDIEPYLLPGYHLAVERWLSAYFETLREVRAAGGLPLEVAVPFWWAGQPYRGGNLPDALAPLVDSVAVMNYRTDPARIRESAEPFLAWGTRHRRSVRIALEAGPIEDEIVRHYRPAPSGQLWRLELAGQPVLVLLDRAAPPPGGRAYAYSHETRAPGSAITFRGQAGPLVSLVEQLEREWQAWPSFQGVALHEFEPE